MSGNNHGKPKEISQSRETTSIWGLHTKWWVLIAIGTSTFMSALDTSVVNIVLPVIQENFDSDVSTIEWIVTVYLLVVSGLLLSFGRLGDLHGHKRVFLIGFIIFIFSSALCGMAPSAGSLIGFRALQAIGAAMLASNSPAILTNNFPANQRGQALGLQATMTYLGLTVAPSFGGWLTYALSWRAVFYINIPVGLTALFLSLRFIPDDSPVDARERFDTLGALTFIISLVILLLGLNQGHVWGWTSPITLGVLIISGLVIGAFLYVESQSLFPMLELSLFRNRVFSASVASAIINYICVFGVIFLMPFYLIQGRGLNPAQAGLILTMQPIVMAIVAPISGTISDRIGMRLPCVLGMAVLSIGLYLLSRIGPNTPYYAIALAFGVTGFGTGTFISPNNSAIMGAAPQNRKGIAAGMLATARSVGMALGVGLAGAIFTTILSHSRLESAETAFYVAIQTSFLITSGIAILGVVTSAIHQQNEGFNMTWRN